MPLASILGRFGNCRDRAYGTGKTLLLVRCAGPPAWAVLPLAPQLSCGSFPRVVDMGEGEVRGKEGTAEASIRRRGSPCGSGGLGREDREPVTTGSRRL